MLEEYWIYHFIRMLLRWGHKMISNPSFHFAIKYFVKYLPSLETTFREVVASFLQLGNT